MLHADVLRFSIVLQSTSDAGRRIQQHFKNHAQTYPMVLGQGGLVLYEKCSSTDEATLLNRLSKPKTARAPTAPVHKRGKVDEGMSSLGATSTGSHSAQPSIQKEQDWKSTWSSKSKTLPSPSPLPAAATTTPSTSSSSLKYGIKVKLTPSKEQEELASYVQREKGLMTHSFTWGGRLHSGPSEMSGVSRQTWALGTKKPPLRL